MDRMWFSLSAATAALCMAAVAVPAWAGENVWSPIGPFGGTVTGLAVVPGPAATVYAATYGSGIFKSGDGGATWEPASQGLTDLSMLTVAVAPNGGLWASSLGGVVRSRDGGAHWKPAAPTGLPAPAGLGGTQFAFAASDPAVPTIYLAGGLFVFKSTDGGVTWSETGPADPNLSILIVTVAVDPQDPRVVLAGGNQGIFRSGDGGATWQAVDAGCHAETLLFDPQRPARVFAGCRGSLPSQHVVETGVRESLDGGRTWRFSRAGLGALGVYALAAQPGAPSTFFAGTSGGGVYRSTDAGAHWAPFNPGAAGLGVATVGVLASAAGAGAPLLAGTGIARETFLQAPGAGIFRTAGGSWVQSNAGLTVATLTLAVDTSGAGRLFVGAPTLGIYRTRSAGAIWTLLNNGLTDRDVVDLVSAPSDPTVLYAVSNFNTLFASTDYGRSFAVRPTAFVRPHTTGIQALAVDPADPQHLLLGAVAIDESRDGGTTWQAVAGGPSEAVFSLQFAASDPVVAYAAGLQAASQPQDTSGSLFASADGGGGWQAVSADQLGGYAVDASQASRLYAFGQSGIAVSTDGGVTFAPTSLGQPISCATTSPHLPGFVAACGEGTVWLSRDGGATWSSLSDGLMAQTVFASLVFDPVLPGTLYGSTGPGGVYALSF